MAGSFNIDCVGRYSTIEWVDVTIQMCFPPIGRPPKQHHFPRIQYPPQRQRLQMSAYRALFRRLSNWSLKIRDPEFTSLQHLSNLAPDETVAGPRIVLLAIEFEMTASLVPTRRFIGRMVRSERPLARSSGVGGARGMEIDHRCTKWNDERSTTDMSTCGRRAIAGGDR